jgi:hypothetical protein
MLDDLDKELNSPEIIETGACNAPCSMSIIATTIAYFLSVAEPMNAKMEARPKLLCPQ